MVGEWVVGGCTGGGGPGSEAARGVGVYAWVEGGGRRRRLARRQCKDDLLKLDKASQIGQDCGYLCAVVCVSLSVWTLCVCVCV